MKKKEFFESLWCQSRFFLEHKCDNERVFFFWSHRLSLTEDKLIAFRFAKINYSNIELNSLQIRAWCTHDVSAKLMAVAQKYVKSTD